jgi:hypothetical protein
MCDNETDSTHISFKSISEGIKDVLAFKLQVDTTLKNFSNSINSLNASIVLYNEQLKTQSVNNSVHSSEQGKKKFCSNTNNNIDDLECNNNNNKTRKKNLEYSLYYQSDKEAREDSQNGKTELEKVEILLQHHLKKMERLKAKQKRRTEKENKNLEINMNDELHLHPIIIQQPETTSDNSSNISSTDNSTKHSTSSLVIPAPSSKDTIIKIRSSNKKPLPEIIDSHNPKGKWSKITKEKKQKIETTPNSSSNISSTTNNPPTTPKTSVPTTSNNEDKIKRKRDQVRQTSNPSIVYTEEPSANTSSDYYSDDDMDGDNDDHVDDSTITNATPINTTTTDPGAFDLDAVTPTETNN